MTATVLSPDDAVAAVRAMRAVITRFIALSPEEFERVQRAWAADLGRLHRDFEHPDPNVAVLAARDWAKRWDRRLNQGDPH